MSFPKKTHNRNNLSDAYQMGYPHQFFPESVTVQNAVLPFNPNMSQLSQTSTGNNAVFSTSNDHQEANCPKFNHSSIEYKYD